MTEQVKVCPSYQMTRCHLQIVFEPNCENRGLIASSLRFLKKPLPDAITIGMTTPRATNEKTQVPEHAVSTFLSFDLSEAITYVSDCHEIYSEDLGFGCIRSLK